MRCEISSSALVIGLMKRVATTTWMAIAPSMAMAGSMPGRRLNWRCHPRKILIAIRTVVQDVPIKDLQTSQLPLAIADTNLLKSIKVTVDIEHTYIGDLIVSVKPPASVGVNPVILHNRQGGSTDNLKKTYDEVNAPNLAAFKGKSPSRYLDSGSGGQGPTRRWQNSQFHP